MLRRVSCDAELIPYVLGTAGEDLDMGRVVRLFTRAQRRRLWRRDRGCTYPGCTAPGAWAKAHHVRHWIDGGLSDLDNAALLCQRHHTFVHQRRLVAQVRARPDDHGRYVVWDLTVGGYDRHLEELHRERSAHDPPPLTPGRLRELLTTVGGQIAEEDPGADAWEREWAAHQLTEHAEDPGVPESWLEDASTPDIIEALERAS